MRLARLVVVAACAVGPALVAPRAMQRVPDPPVAGQQAGSGAISGVVRDAATRRPIPGVVVYVGVQGRGAVSRFSRQVTDATGRFVFTGLPASDSFFLQASKFGYFDGGYGRRGPAGVPGRIALGDAEWVADAEIEMWRPGAIGGVVHDERGEPLVNVFVRVFPQVLVGGRPHLAAGPTATTDDRGAYRIAGLAAGKYIVSVPSVQISVPAGATPADSAAAASIAQTASVEVDRASRLLLWQFPIPPPLAGRRPYAYAPAFYPSASTIDGATQIDLGYGDDRGAIDFVMTPVPTATVSGKVEGPPEALASLTLRLVASGAEELGPGSETATAVVGADGRFTFPSVPAGAYTIEASHTVASFEAPSMIGQLTSLPDQPGTGFTGMSTTTISSASQGTRIGTRSTPGGDRYWGRALVTVDSRDVTGVRVVMQPAARLSGRLVWDGRPPSSNGIGLLVFAEPASAAAVDGFGRGASRSSDLTAFAIEGLRPGEYFLRFLGAGSSVVKSVSSKGRDQTYQPIEVIGSDEIDDVVVTFTDKGASLEGIVRDDRGAPASSAAVIVFPAEREQWSRYGFTPQRIKRTAVANTSKYTLRSLPAGDYFVIAVDADSGDGWKDPAFLEAAQALASPVRLEWGDTKTMDLTLARVR